MAPRADVWDTPTAVHHTVILGNDGLPDHVTLEDADAAAALERLCYQLPKAWLKTPRHGKRRLAVYAHGGLNDLAAALDRAQVMGPWFEQNGIYPVFVAWQSGVADTIESIIGDLIGELVGHAQDRKSRSLVDTVSEARDYLIEAAAIVPARPVWNQMKQNAVAASDGDGGMVALGSCLARLAKDYPGLEIHLVGHSAGAILLGAFLTQLASHRLAARTVSLYAPACTVAFANRHYLPAAENEVIDPRRVVFDVLSDSNELDDTVGPYGKSLLYLVSRALEPAHKTPILGMEATWNPRLDKEGIFRAPAPGKPNPDVAFWRKAWLEVSDRPKCWRSSAWSRSSPPSASDRSTAASTTGSRASSGRSRGFSTGGGPNRSPCGSGPCGASRPRGRARQARGAGASGAGRRRRRRPRRGGRDARRARGGPGRRAGCAFLAPGAPSRARAACVLPRPPAAARPRRLRAARRAGGRPPAPASAAATPGTPKAAFARSQNSRRSASPFRPPLIRRVIVTKSPASASALRPFRAQNHAAARHPGSGVVRRSGASTRSTPMPCPHAR